MRAATIEEIDAVMAVAPGARHVSDPEARLLLQDRVAKAESAIHAHLIIATAAACDHAASLPARVSAAAPVAAPAVLAPAKRGSDNGVRRDHQATEKMRFTFGWTLTAPSTPATSTRHRSCKPRWVDAPRALTPLDLDFVERLTVVMVWQHRVHASMTDDAADDPVSAKALKLAETGDKPGMRK
eukprot:jgi/Tetstr1/429230/TSEL_001893.t1